MTNTLEKYLDNGIVGHVPLADARFGKLCESYAPPPPPPGSMPSLRPPPISSAFVPLIPAPPRPDKLDISLPVRELGYMPDRAPGNEVPTDGPVLKPADVGGRI